MIHPTGTQRNDFLRAAGATLRRPPGIQSPVTPPRTPRGQEILPLLHPMIRTPAPLALLLLLALPAAACGQQPAPQPTPGVGPAPSAQPAPAAQPAPVPQPAPGAQPAPALQMGGRPPSAVVVDALLEAVAAGTNTAAREFISRHTTPEFRASAPLDAHVTELRRMHREIGRAAMVDLRRLPSGEREAHLRSLEGDARWVLRLEMEDAAPHRVGRMRWRQDVLTGALDGRMRAEVLESLIESVEGMYVSPDTAAMITAHLRARAAAGAYDALTDRRALAEVLTRDLQAINGDGHLYVRDATSGPVAGGAGMPVVTPSSAEGPAALGFTRVERLPGNVGYIEIAAPLSGRPGRDAEDRALVGEVVRQMEGADVVIIDLRSSPGGSALLANHLVSHFLPAGRHLFTVESRLSGTMSERRAAAEVPGPRLLSVPVYVLTSGRTFSAGEDIAFSFASQGRATLVGEPTRGGGRNNIVVPIAHGMRASISVTRVIDPRTGGEAWERVGVPVDIEVPAADALQAALRHAGK
jgi:hypothetical protein